MSVVLPFPLEDQISSYRNGEAFCGRVKDPESSIGNGLRLTTQSGREVIVTRDQLLWASLPEYSNVGAEQNTSVYLMYREGFGFRVGITNKGYSKAAGENFSSRLVQEGGDKLWILDSFLSREEALLKEVTYSLQYSVPTSVFKGESRGLNQNHINSLFKIFGGNGLKILMDRGISFDLPHWQNSSANREFAKRNVITFVNHSPKGSQVSLEWTDFAEENSISHILKKDGVAFSKAKGDGRWRIRKFCNSNREAVSFFNKIKSLLHIDAKISLSNPETRLVLLTAGSVHVGMSLPIFTNEKIALDQIIKIDNISNLDLVSFAVDDSNLFLLSDIVLPGRIEIFSNLP